jgi:hypothetical protein
MLHAAGDYMVSGFEYTIESDIERFGYVFCKDDPEWVGAIEKIADCFPGVIYNTTGIDGHPVAGPAGIGAGFRHAFSDCCGHFRWFRPGGCGIVEVNHSIFTLWLNFLAK